MVFKFQSDSINTPLKRPGNNSYPALNSDLILLIPVLPVTLRRSVLPLNSNLILLIPGTDGKGIDTYAAVFKFQSDSINTKSVEFGDLLKANPLNSNLILLIPFNTDMPAICTIL